MTVADVYVFDDATIPAPIEEAVVTLLDADGELVTSVETDEDGRAAFDVPDATYEVRVFKRGYGSDVSQIVVDTSEDTNEFDITLEDLTTLPVTTDPRMCRCTGVFVDFQGRPTKGVMFRLNAPADYGTQVPKIADGNLVYPSSMSFQSDALGVVSVDLFRGAEYTVVFAGEDDTSWSLKVPDRASVNLIDLIFPAPVLLSWDQDQAPGNEITVAVGDTGSVQATLLFSDYQTKTVDLNNWLEFSNSDGDVVELGFLNSSGVVALRALAAGTAEITAALVPNLLPYRVPPYSLTAATLLVTVTS